MTFNETIILFWETTLGEFQVPTDIPISSQSEGKASNIINLLCENIES